MVPDDETSDEAGPDEGTTVLEGIIETAMPRGLYEVRTEAGTKVRATLSTQAKRIAIKAIPGDRVLVEMSPYDDSRARITAVLR